MINLRMENEYLAGPIFCPDLDKMGHIDVEDLPISQVLKDEILAWDEVFRSTFNSDYPPDSGFNSPELEAAHIEKGRKLAERLQAEMGENYTVQYKT